MSPRVFQIPIVFDVFELTFMHFRLRMIGWYHGWRKVEKNTRYTFNIRMMMVWWCQDDTNWNNIYNDESETEQENSRLCKAIRQKRKWSSVNSWYLPTIYPFEILNSDCLRLEVMISVVSCNVYTDMLSWCNKNGENIHGNFSMYFFGWL